MAEGDGDLVLLLAVSLVLAVVVAGCMKVGCTYVSLGGGVCCLCVGCGDRLDCWLDRSINRSIDQSIGRSIQLNRPINPFPQTQSSDDGPGSAAQQAARQRRPAGPTAAAGTASMAAAAAAKQPRAPARPLSARAKALQRELGVPFGAAVTFATHHVRPCVRAYVCG